MLKSDEIFEQIKELYTQFESEHNGTSKIFQNQDNKKAIGEIKKLVTDYRKPSRRKQIKVIKT